MTQILRGRLLRFVGDPFRDAPDAAVRVDEDGAVAMAEGRILAVGPAEDVVARHPSAPVDRFADDFLLPGFVDAHAHYPQIGVIASYGAQLLEWLERYTFPEETKFADAAYARRAADAFLDETARNGVTTVSAYCTIHPQSVDAIFEAAAARGVRIAAGKVMMDRNAPDGLLDDAQSSYDQSKALLDRWHGRGRASYVVTPRFAPTSTPDQLAAAGALWAERPTAGMQTHISENRREIAWVAELFPDARDYLDVYERFGLVGPGANFGHAIHLTERERGALRDSGSGVSHCPTSNAFIGSGLFDLAGLRGGATPIPVGLATDVGGGSSFSMLQTMRSAYEIAQLRGDALHPYRALYLATKGAAEVLRLDSEVGDLAPGFEADIVVLDLNATPLLSARVGGAETASEALFAAMILGDDRAVRRTYAAGRLIHDRDAAPPL